MKPRRIVLQTGAAIAVAASCALFAPGVPAYADDVADAQAAVDSAQSTLDSAELQVASLMDEYSALQQESDQIQLSIDETVAQASETQKAVIAGRASLSKTADYQYRNDVESTFLSLLLNSDSLGDLLKNMQNIQFIMNDQAQQIAQQKQLSARYDAQLTMLNNQKDQQDAKLAAMETARVEAQNVVSEAAAKLQNTQDDQASRLQALNDLAQSMVADAASEGTVDEGWNTIEHPADVEGNTTVTDSGSSSSSGSIGGGSSNAGSDSSAGSGSSSGSNGSSESKESSGSSSSDAGWSTGVASAYGGSSDPYTPNPGTTATGAVCNDSSMGVAVPMSWPNYRSYFGRSVEIEYNGTTVIATVNDCGYMGGGSRSLDLQPGVWKAFGYSTCQAWGIRTVNYRFL